MFVHSLYDGVVNLWKPSVEDYTSVGDAQLHNSQEAVLPICPAVIDISHHDKIPVSVVQEVGHGVKVCKRVLPDSTRYCFRYPFGRLD